MNSSYGARNAAAGPSTGQISTNANGPKPKKKKARQDATPSPRPSSRATGPVPQPYLALAPSPVSSMSRSTLDEIALPPARKLVLPSTYPNGRASKSTPNVNIVSSSPGRRGYVAGLLAPPSIRPGGTPLPPRVQGEPAAPRRRSAPRVGVGGGEVTGRRRSEERLRDVREANMSMASLGVLGQIMENDPLSGGVTPTPDGRGRSTTPNPPATDSVQPAPRRRRRIVRAEEGDSLARRLTVSSREEGRAMGLARGASMRRVNVWDDVPEAADAPPPFPFPTSSSSRLPPTIDARSSPTSPTSPQRGAEPYSLNPTMINIPNSPPPVYAELPTSAARESVAEEPTITEREENAEMGSPATQYASAPTSPIISAVSLVDGVNEADEGREDRMAWNADIAEGLSLEERVKREAERKLHREESMEPFAPREIEQPVDAAGEARAETARKKVKGKGKASAQLAIVEPMSHKPHVDANADVDATKAASPIASTSRFVEGDVPEAPRKAKVKKKKKRSATPAESEMPAESATIGLGIRTDPVPVLPAQMEVVSNPLDTPVVNAEQTDGGAKTDRGSATVSPVLDVAPHTGEPSDGIVEPKASLAPVAIPIVDLSAETIPTAPVPTEPIEAKVTAPAHIGDVVIQQSPPERKLTRGKAIRRSSSGLTNSPDAQARRASRRISASMSPRETPTTEAPEPLFPSGVYHFGANSSPQPTVTASPMPPSNEKLEPTPLPESVPEEAPPVWAYRASVPTTSTSSRQTIPRQSLDSRVSPAWGGLAKGYKLSDPSPPAPSLPTVDLPLGPVDEEVGKGLPPHREAALKRRELSLRRRSSPPPVPSKSPRSSPARVLSNDAPPVSGPLIDFGNSSPTSTVHDLSHLMMTSHELLSLLEAEETEAEREAVFVTPAAESSSQAAARAASLAIAPIEDLDRVDPITSSSADHSSQPVAAIEEATVPKKRAPPPPPASRPRGASGLAPRRSIIASANSPVTPRPIHRPPAPPPPGAISPSIPQDVLPITSLDRVPSMPTRRPPPPPPKPLTSEPAAPPPPPPPAWTSRPSHLRNDSLVSASDTASTTSDSVQTSLPPWQPLNTRSVNTLTRTISKPKGPRPPPVPARPWRKAPVTRPTLRTIGERTHSDNVLSPTREHGVAEDDVDEEMGGRSNSMAELRSAAESDVGVEERSPVEYTDLDVLVSRLEGSGREYEGFTQISNFLGPAKSPAATPEALATLLPAPISVDSRRTTAQGKVKLKLSLLGVRVSKCPICLAQYKEAETAVLLPICGHHGHEECARKWFREDDRCFVCRVPLLRADEGEV